MSCEAVNSFLFNIERLTNIVIRYVRYEKEFSVLKPRANTAKFYLVPFANFLKYFMSVNPYGMT